MVSVEAVKATSKCPQVEPDSSPRISFSADFLDENNFISICPKERERERDREIAARNVDFEFLSGDITNMIAADEVFSQGKMLPFSWQLQPLNKIALKTQHTDDRRISWLIDDDPSPRPPKCTVLWKELLRLKKPRPSTLSPSSSETTEARKQGAAGSRDNKVVNKVKKGLEITNIRIRPMINVPICTAAKNTALPPLFPTRRGSA